MNDNKSLIKWIIGIFLISHILLSYQVYQKEYIDSGVEFIDYYTKVRKDFVVIVLILILSILVGVWRNYGINDPDIYKFKNGIQWCLDRHQKSKSDINFILSERFEVIPLIKNRKSAQREYFMEYYKILTLYRRYKEYGKYDYGIVLDYIFDSITVTSPINTDRIHLEDIKVLINCHNDLHVAIYNNDYKVRDKMDRYYKVLIKRLSYSH